LSVFKSRLKRSYFVVLWLAHTTDCRQRLWSYDLIALYK